MTHTEKLSHWAAEINLHFPTLSSPQSRGLALWSTGMVLAGSASLEMVALRLHIWLAETGKSLDAVRERLRSLYLPASRKPGCKRSDWHPDTVFADLATWVLSLLSGTRLVLALDATTLRDDITILCVSILIGGCAIPVAWRCVGGNEEGCWNAHWLELLQRLSSAIAPERQVVVLADRGIWSPLIFIAIIDRGWHPLMRINPGEELSSARFHVQNRQQSTPRQSWKPMSSFAPAQGKEVQLTGEAFVSHPINCTLIIYWGETAKEPWYRLSDAPSLPDLKGSLYAERMWIEHQFKTIKSDGWHADKSRIKDPDRAARLWLAYAVGMLWTLSVGSQPIIGLDHPNYESARADESSKACLNASGETNTKADPTGEQKPLKLPGPALYPDTPCDCVEHVRRTFSWFAKGIAALAEQINNAIEATAFRCPKFYCAPARNPQLRNC